MESSVGELSLILGAVYLVECLRWVPRGSVVVQAVPGLGAWPVRPWQLAVQFRRALAPGFPLPPFGSLLCAEPLPFVPGPAGVRLLPGDAQRWTSPAAGDVFVPWGEARRLQVVEEELTLDGRAVHRFGSRRAARACRQLLERAPRAPDRVVAAELERRADAGVLRHRLAAWRRWRWRVALASSLLFLSVFGGLALWLFTPRAPLGQVVVAVLVTWVATAAVVVVAVRRVLEPPLRPGTGQWLVTLLSPLSLMRAADLVEQELCGDLEPAAVVSVGLGPRPARQWLEAEARALAHPLVPEGAEPAGPAVVADDAWWRARCAERVEALLAALPAGAPELPGGRHCPRCLTEYVSDGVRVCASCPGVPLTRTRPG